MIKIKTPVRYDDSQLAVIDADGEILCQLDLWLDEIEMDGERVGDQIADALNRTADLEAKLATATETERERAAKICEDMRVLGGPTWTREQTACYNALNLAARTIRDTEFRPIEATISGDTKGDDDGK